MNPLNSQSSQTQYFITTGSMPTLTPNSDQHLTTSVATNSVMNSHQHPPTNHFIDANKFVTTSYVPVLLTNQTLITNIETQQQQPQTQQTSPSTIINVSNSPVVAATANIPLITSNPVGGGGGNVTYVVTSPQTQNFGTMLPGQILLTAPTTMATSGE